MTATEQLLARALGLLERGEGATALPLLEAARRRSPEHAEIACRYADALQLSGHLGEAVDAYARALALAPDNFDAWYGRGCAELASGAYAAAAASLQRAVALRADAGPCRVNLGKALYELGLIEAALAQLRIASADRSAEVRRRALAAIATIIPGDPGSDAAAVLAARRAWAQQELALLPARGQPPSPPARGSDEGPLRIGYVSSFFAARNWMKPVFGLINHHDRARFELHLFADGAPPAVEAGYRDHERDVVHLIRGLTNGAAAAAVARAGIDVLVDLNGYSAPERLPLFMLRPAPAILGWFNIYATTGIDAFDALVADDCVLGEREERDYGERILRVPGSYLAFSILYPTPEVTPPPCLERGCITFGCFGSNYKFTDGVCAAWARILRGAPQSRLVLRNRSLGDASCRDSLLERLTRHGIAAERVLLGGGAEHEAFLAAYADMDIALDTFPYNGGTTTTEALWQGVPVLSFAGDRWASRTSCSLLRAAGLGDWVMPDLEGYVDRAVALARAAETPALLPELRRGMRQRLLSSPACDSAGLCRAMEAIYCALATARSNNA